MRRSPLISVYAFLTVAVIAFIGLALAQQWYADDGCTGDAWKCEVGNSALTTFVLSIYAAMAAVVLGVIELVVRAIARFQQLSPWRELLMGVVLGLVLEVAAQVVWRALEL